MLKEQIIQVLKNTFKLTAEADISELNSRADVAAIPKLPALLACLADERTIPKQLREALEQVIVSIKLKDKRTATEVTFLKEEKRLIEDPLYEEPRGPGSDATAHTGSSFGTR